MESKSKEQFNLRYSKPRSVANSTNDWKGCSDDAGDYRNGFPGGAYFDARPA